MVVRKPENVMLINAPVKIIGRTLVTLPFVMSKSIVGESGTVFLLVL